MANNDPKGRQKKGWKAFQADYDFVFAQSDRGCTYCLTLQQTAALLAMTEYLSWPTRWVSEVGEIDRDLIASFTDGLERALMAGCCDDNMPIQYRWLADGTLQRSLNGGGTWVDAPEFDPRNNSPQSPPLPDDETDQVRCDMAASVAEAIKEQVGEQLTDDMSRYTLDELLQDWVTTYINFWDPFTAIVTIAANQIFALVIAALRAALTDAVYDDLKCLVLESMPADGLWTPAAAETLRASVSAGISGIAGQFLQHLIFLMGAVGLTNLSRSGFVTGADCDDCSDTCWDGWEPIIPTGGSFEWGIILSKTETQMVVTGTEVAPGLFRALISNVDNSNCVSWTASGIVGTTAAGACGVDNANMPSDSGLWFSPPILSNAAFFAENGANFTVTLTCV